MLSSCGCGHVWWCIPPFSIVWAAPRSQECLSGLGLCVMSWMLKRPLIVPGTYMAKRGGMGHTRDSCSLAMVGSERRDNQSFHDSPRTLLPLIVAWVEQYHCYWSFEKILVITDLDCGQDGDLLLTKANNLVNPINRDPKWGPLSCTGGDQHLPLSRTLVRACKLSGLW